MSAVRIILKMLGPAKIQMTKADAYRKRTEAITRPDFKPTFFDSPLTSLVLVCGTLVIGVSVWFIGLS